MYYIPDKKILKVEEFFPKVLCKQEGHSDAIWRRMDIRILKTVVALRQKYGAMVINDYLWGGKNQLRGFRPFEYVVDRSHFILTKELRPLPGCSLTSQHCFGRAIDCHFINESVDKVREDIVTRPNSYEFRFITAIELDVPWLHIDVRPWDKTRYGILTFGPPAK